MNDITILIISAVALGLFLTIPYVMLRIWYKNRNQKKIAMEVLKYGISKEEYSRRCRRAEEENKAVGTAESGQRGLGSSNSRIRGERRGIFRRIFGRSRSKGEGIRDKQESEAGNIGTADGIAPEQRKIQDRAINSDAVAEQQPGRNSKRTERDKQPFKSAFD